MARKPLRDDGHTLQELIALLEDRAVSRHAERQEALLAAFFSTDSHAHGKAHP